MKKPRLKYKALFEGERLSRCAVERKLELATRELERLHAVMAPHGSAVITQYKPPADGDTSVPILLAALDFECVLAFLRSNARGVTGQDTWDGPRTAFWYGRRIVSTR